MARPRTRQSVRSGDPGAHRPLLLSSRRYTSDRDRLTVSALGARFATAKDVFLAAAFYDIPFCRALLAHVPREANRIRLVFNGLGGARLLTQRKELTELERALRKRIRSVEVRLAFEPGLFHTKLLLIRQPRKLTAFVGSANATMAAMSLNEEILLEVSGEGPIESYADRIWASSTPLAELSERLTAKTLIARGWGLYACRTRIRKPEWVHSMAHPGFGWASDEHLDRW
jgi:phosphatidylserine/phosphatidylglycerophosphate/cardiolipin synthase-like enzyme